MTLTRETAEKMGGMAAHVGMSESQLRSMFLAMGYSASSAVARYAETSRRQRLVWMAEEGGEHDAHEHNSMADA